MKLKRPLIIINFKAYEQATGKNAVKLAKICNRVATRTKTNIAVAVQPADISKVKAAVKIPVLAQHVDPFGFGKNTGSILAKSVKEAGAVGTLINHSERHLSLDEISFVMAEARKANLECVVCARTAGKAEKIAWMHPDFVAIEPPELIGGKVSISKAKPSLITNTVKKVQSVEDTPVLAGAGVRNKKDVATALKLGAEGVLVASDICKARDPEKELKNLVLGFK